MSAYMEKKVPEANPLFSIEDRLKRIEGRLDKALRTGGGRSNEKQTQSTHRQPTYVALFSKLRDDIVEILNAIININEEDIDKIEMFEEFVAKFKYTNEYDDCKANPESNDKLLVIVGILKALSKFGKKMEKKLAAKRLPETPLDIESFTQSLYESFDA